MLPKECRIDVDQAANNQPQFSMRISRRACLLFCVRQSVRKGGSSDHST